MGEMSPEAPFETRYFSVVLDAYGKVTSTNLNNIAAVSEDQAEELAQKVMKAGESKGFIVKYSTEGSEIHVSLERKGRKLIYQISNETDQIAKGNVNIL